MMWDPLRYLESCPSSDGACAVVLTDEAGGNAAAAAGRPPAWILGTSSRSEPPSFPGRDPVRPAGVPAVRRRRLPPGRHHRPPRADRHGRAVRAVLVARADLARSPRHRRRGRGLEDDRRRRHRARRLVPGQRLGRRAVDATRSARPGCCASPRRPTRCAARPASTRSTAPRSRWPWPTARRASTSRMWVVANSLQPFG